MIQSWYYIHTSDYCCQVPVRSLGQSDQQSLAAGGKARQQPSSVYFVVSLYTHKIGKLLKLNTFLGCYNIFVNK
jgi:hypothetical protein